MTIAACDTCGAITAIIHDGEPSIDNREQHDQWHASLRGAIRQAGSPIGGIFGSQLEGI